MDVLTGNRTCSLQAQASPRSLPDSFWPFFFFVVFGTFAQEVCCGAMACRGHMRCSFELIVFARASREPCDFRVTGTLISNIDEPEASDRPVRTYRGLGRRGGRSGGGGVLVLTLLRARLLLDFAPVGHHSEQIKRHALLSVSSPTCTRESPVFSSVADSHYLPGKRRQPQGSSAGAINRETMRYRRKQLPTPKGSSIRFLLFRLGKAAPEELGGEGGAGGRRRLGQIRLYIINRLAYR